MGYFQWEYESHKSFPHKDLRNHIIDWKASGKSTKCPWAWANFCPGSQSFREIDLALEFVFLILQWNTFVRYENKYLLAILSRLSICWASEGQSPRLEPQTYWWLSPLKAPQGLGRPILTNCSWLRRLSMAHVWEPRHRHCVSVGAWAAVLCVKVGYVKQQPGISLFFNMWKKRNSNERKKF